jgi:hypothetical protein
MLSGCCLEMPETNLVESATYAHMLKDSGAVEISGWLRICNGKAGGDSCEA